MRNFTATEIRVGINWGGEKMSRITSITKKDMARNTKHNESPATYCVFEKDGTKFFQIDTYGKPDREYSWQPSQKIQFDEVFAKKLISILNEEFGA
jgi:hypothetical protein